MQSKTKPSLYAYYQISILKSYVPEDSREQLKNFIRK